MQTKLPALQFYVGDWKKDLAVQSLSLEEKGAWFEILLLLHESEKRGLLLLNGQPMPNAALAKNLGVEESKTEQIVSKILEYGVASRDPETGALCNRRMLRDNKLRQVRAEAGRLGGKQNGKQEESKKEAKRPASSSFSSSTSNRFTAPPVLNDEQIRDLKIKIHKVMGFSLLSEANHQHTDEILKKTKRAKVKNKFAYALKCAENLKNGKRKK